MVQKGAYNISECQGRLGEEGLEAGEEDTGGTTPATRSIQESCNQNINFSILDY